MRSKNVTTKNKAGTNRPYHYFPHLVRILVRELLVYKYS